LRTWTTCPSEDREEGRKEEDEGVDDAPNDLATCSASSGVVAATDLGVAIPYCTGKKRRWGQRQGKKGRDGERKERMIRLSLQRRRGQGRGEEEVVGEKECPV